MDGVGAFYSYISCDPTRAGEVMEIVRRILNNLPDLVKEEDIEKAKNKVLSALTIKNERPMGRLVDLGFDWTYLRKYVPIQEEIEDIRAVKGSDVMDIVGEFKPGVFTEFSLGPGK
jgi:predicted Zn-dependent peptidase